MIKEALKTVLEKQQEIESVAWEVVEQASEQVLESNGIESYDEVITKITKMCKTVLYYIISEV